MADGGAVRPAGGRDGWLGFINADIDAFSSTKSRVNEYGVRMASSKA